MPHWPLPVRAPFPVSSSSVTLALCDTPSPYLTWTVSPSLTQPGLEPPTRPRRGPTVPGWELTTNGVPQKCRYPRGVNEDRIRFIMHHVPEHAGDVRAL